MHIVLSRRLPPIAPPPRRRCCWSASQCPAQVRPWSIIGSPFSALARLNIQALASLIIWLAGLLLTPSPSAAAPTSPLRFRNIVLPGNSSILALHQDRRGFIWVGTQGGGLLRYDGNATVKYSNIARETTSLPSNRVSAIHEDNQGRIWVGTRAGLARFDPLNNNFIRFIAPGENARRLDVKAIISDGKDGLWIATWGGIQHLDLPTATFRTFVHREGDPTSLLHDDVNALALDRRGGLWAATWPGGLDYLAPGARGFAHFRVDQADAANARLNNVRSLRFDRLHTLWIGSERGIVRWQDGRPWSTRARVASPQVRTHQLYLDGSGTVWAGTLSAGLSSYAEGRDRPARYVHRSGDPYSLPADNVRAILVDRTGMLWAGTFTDGVGISSLQNSGLKRIIPFDDTAGDQRASNMMSAIADAGKGNLWLGGSSGLSLFAPQSGAVIARYRAAARGQGSLGSDMIYSLYRSPAGPLWIGTANGLDRFEPRTGKFSTVHFGNPADDFVNSISAGSNDTLWLGTGNSVIRYHTVSGSVQSFSHRATDPRSRSVQGASCILEDRHGRVWIGSENGGGLDLLDPESGLVRHFRHRESDPSGLASDVVTSLHEDRSGRLWVGTDKGLNEIIVSAGGEIAIRQFRGAGGVGEVRVLSVQSDAAGQIWLSALNGLLKVDPGTGTALKYTDADGISDSFTVGAATTGADGTIYFGGMRGMTAVRPTEVGTRSAPPQVAIADVAVLNRPLTAAVRRSVWVSGPLSAPSALSLSSEDLVFSIEFAALHFADPGKNSFLYMMEGFDSDWVAGDAQHRSATYTNLSPGHYRFRVRAFNDKGVPSIGEAAMAVEVRPPYWQTWWFRISVASLSALVFAAGYYWHIRRYIRHQKQLELLVAARTSEIKEANQKLELLALTDGLTEVANRRAFDAALTREWKRAARRDSTLALILLDVDYFKLYNDHYGHQGGDQCLQKIAQLLSNRMRRPADLVARYGGEEFVLLLPDTGADAALHMAEAICIELANLAMPHVNSPHGVVTISAGVACVLASQASAPSSLVAAADAALYVAKARGRNRACPGSLDAQSPDRR